MKCCKHPKKKKKPDSKLVTNTEEDINYQLKSGINRHEVQIPEKNSERSGMPTGKHDPVIEKPSKTFSIKEIISEDSAPGEILSGKTEVAITEARNVPKIEFSPDAFHDAWKDFMDQLNGEGTRIISMFKSITPEVENDQTIKVHLSNAAQKDTFVQNYKQKLITFLENKFTLSGIDIDTVVDLSDKNEILYTDEQKSNYLFTKYPILKEMKKSFNLDIT
jgi:hypothetical protein